MSKEMTIKMVVHNNDDGVDDVQDCVNILNELLREGVQIYSVKISPGPMVLNYTPNPNMPAPKEYTFQNLEAPIK